MNKARAFDEQYRPELIERIPVGWLPAYDLPMMTRDMIERIRRRQS